MPKKKAKPLITRAQIRSNLAAVLGTYATKKELSRAIREAIKDFTNSEDVRREVQGALRSYASKEELAKEVARLVSRDSFLAMAIQMQKNTEDIADIRANMMTKADGDRIMSALDHLMTEYDNHTRKVLVQDERLRLLEERCPAPSVGGA